MMTEKLNTSGKLKDITKNAADSAKKLTQNAAEAVGRQVQKSIRMTRNLGWYLFKFGLRLTVFCVVFFFYLTDRDTLQSFMNQPFFAEFTPLTLVWLLFMLIMVTHLIPNNRLTMAWRKARGNVYRPVKDYDRAELLEQVQKLNMGAWKVMLVWLSFNAIFATLYLTGVIQSLDLLMLTVFYFLSDYICILFFCPFQNFLMKNKCCINCRIFDWGHFMIFTPMLFIKNFFSWSLFFTSILVLIHWEIFYARHPERFWEGSNKTLQCANCKEQTCQIKRKLTHNELKR